MPLLPELRSAVNSYIFRDLIPRNTGYKPFEWFLKQFDFIEKEELQHQLAESYYQARFLEKIREALGLRGSFNNVFIKFQIVQYAAIYEAVIDYFLEQATHIKRVEDLLFSYEFRAVDVLAKGAEIVFLENEQMINLTLCRKRIRNKQLKEIQFSQRLDTAVHIGLVPDQLRDMLKELYDSRNSVHLIAAAVKSFTPNEQQSSEAFQQMLGFLEDVREWKKQHFILKS